MMETQAWSGREQIGVVRARAAAPRSAARLNLASELGKSALPAYRERVFSLCLGFMGNSADARDLTQDTFAKALAHYSQDNPEHVQAWLLRIARNACLDHLRRRKVRGPQFPVSEFSAIDWRTPEKNAGAEEEIRIVREAIAALPCRLREVLVMHEYGELSCLEISRALRISSATATSRLHRARLAVLGFYREEQHGIRRNPERI
jgi:RNA polymerase sigma factor (sigma-70 family)